MIRRCWFSMMILTSAEALCLYVSPLFFPSRSRITLFQKQKQKKKITECHKLILNGLLNCSFFPSGALPSKDTCSLCQNSNKSCQTHIIYQFTVRNGQNPSNLQREKLSDLTFLWEYMLNINIESMILGKKKQII